MRVIIAIAIFSLAMPLGANRAMSGVYAINLTPATAYTVASHATGCPEWVLHGLAFAESSERDDAIGDGGQSIGRFQLREVYHASRAARWGEYDPRDCVEAGIIAGNIIMDNLAALGSLDLAVAAYRQGVAGVKRDGATSWYVERVKGARN